MALKDPTGLEKSVGELYLVMDGPWIISIWRVFFVLLALVVMKITKEVKYNGHDKLFESTIIWR